MAKRALFSVYDKSGLIDFARQLAGLGWELVASGGTAHALHDAGLTVIEVAELTGYPEMLGGRVKTLHPVIHGGILARDTIEDQADLAAQGIGTIDLVACNLYPFQMTVARKNVTLPEAVEQIDIGGVTLLRAAAKNFARVTVVCDPFDYEKIVTELHSGEITETTRRRLAVKAFAHTRDYDIAIASYLQSAMDELTAPPTLPARFSLELTQVQALRYGENPHQAAALYSTQVAGPLGGTLLQGKPLSYNNLLDLDAAWRAVTAFAKPTIVIVKHLSPCGIASGETPPAAFPAALASDPVSAFGGVMAVNRLVDIAFAEAIDAAGLFIEAVVAPDFSQEAAMWFATRKKNCRLVKLADVVPPGLEMRSVRGGILVQEWDTGDPTGSEWQVAGRRQPSESEWLALRFAWKSVQHVKSNAIVLAVAGATVGIGGGLPSRIDAVHLAVAKAGDKARGAVMASDAFFPFPDGVEAAAAAGVTAVVQPGGSIRDEAVIAAADKHNVALVFTGIRHFRH